MEKYIGRENEEIKMPYTGGKYVDEYKEGGEEKNFLDIDGYCYGFVETKRNKNGRNTIRIERIDESYKNCESIDNVLVVWVAANRHGKQKIVGWYKNATVYRQFQYKLISDNDYNITCRANDCFLLPLNERTFEVPVATVKDSFNRFGFGQSNIWYAQEESAENYVKEVIKYIDNYNGERINVVINDEDLDATIDIKNKAVDEVLNEALGIFQNTDSIKYENIMYSLKLCNFILKTDPSNKDAIKLRCFIVSNLLRIKKSIDLFEEYNRKYNDNDYLIYFQLGILYYYDEQMDKAVENLNKSVILNPDYIDSYILLSAVYSYKEDYANALKYYKICIEKDDKILEAYYQIAWIQYYINKNTNEALKYIDKILSIEENNADALYFKAEILYLEGRKNDALSIIEQYLKEDPQNSWFVELKNQIFFMRLEKCILDYLVFGTLYNLKLLYCS
ncbi:tetratricopeptide repeat protein [Fervidicella metallireducens]|nr:tetratricopeptide repeat protein [Fervidicella metallireducens]